MPTERFMREVKPVVGYCPKAQNVEQAYAVTRSIMGTGVPSMFDSLGRSTSQPDADDVIAKRRGVAARRLEPYKQYWHCCKRSLPANAVFLLAADTWGCRMPTMSAMLRSVGAEQTFGPADPGVRRVSIRPRCEASPVQNSEPANTRTVVHAPVARCLLFWRACRRISVPTIWFQDAPRTISETASRWAVNLCL